MKNIFPKNFIKIVLITSIWVNISEVFRYFIIVMPEMHRDLAAIPNVAPMNLFVFSIWGIWDTILTASIVYVTWLCHSKFSTKNSTILIAGIFSWIMFFLLFWIGMINMNLANPKILLYTLPLSLFETLVAAWITTKQLELHND